MTMRMLVVSASKKKYHYGTVSNQLTDVGRGGIVNLLVFYRGGVLDFALWVDKRVYCICLPTYNCAP